MGDDGGKMVDVFCRTGLDRRGDSSGRGSIISASRFHTNGRAPHPISGSWMCAGFRRTLYYYFKSWWSDQTVLHLFPHWNWSGREGQTIDVRCFSNCDEVELLLNGTSLGRKAMKRNSHLAWPVEYQPGLLEARGFRKGKQVVSHHRETTGPAVRIVLEADREVILADGVDVAAITAIAVDANGRAVPTVDNIIRFQIPEGLRLLGVGNGDPSNHDSVTGPDCRLFNGLLPVTGSERIESIPPQYSRHVEGAESRRCGTTHRTRQAGQRRAGKRRACSW